MRKEFPVDKWLRKHLTIKRLIIWLFLVLVCVIFAPMIIEVTMLQTIGTILLYVAMVIAIFLGMWMAYWDIKHPYKPDLCKECGRAKPEKYEDEDD